MQPGVKEAHLKQQLCFLFFTIKTICAYITRIDPNGFQKIIQSVIAKGGKILHLADILYHLLVFLCMWICIFIQNFLWTVEAFSLLDHLTSDQLHLRFGT